MPRKGLPDSREQQYVHRMAERAISNLGLQVTESGWDKINRKYMMRIRQPNSGRVGLVRIGHAMAERCLAEGRDGDVLDEISSQVARLFGLQ